MAQLPPLQPTQRQARRGSSGGRSLSRESSQHSVGSISAGIARQVGIFGSAGRNAKEMGLPLSIDDDITDSAVGEGLIKAIHPAGSSRTSATGGLSMTAGGSAVIWNPPSGTRGPALSPVGAALAMGAADLPPGH